MRGARGAFVVGGMAKGAAMLAPDMATMLAVLTTDAGGDPADPRRGPAPRPSAPPSTPDRRRLHLDQRHRAAPGQRPGRAGRARGELLEAVTEACGSLGRPDGGRRRGRHQGGPRPGDRGPQRRRGPPGRPQGGRLAPGQVLPQRRGPLLGPGGERAGRGRGRPSTWTGSRSPTAGWWSAPAGWRPPTTRRPWPPTWPGATSSIRCDLGLGDGLGGRAHHRPRPRLHRREPDDVVSAATCATPRTRPPCWSRRCPTSGGSSGKVVVVKYGGNALAGSAEGQADALASLRRGRRAPALGRPAAGGGPRRRAPDRRAHAAGWARRPSSATACG